MRTVDGNIVHQFVNRKNQDEIIRRYTEYGWGINYIFGTLDEVTRIDFIRPPGHSLELPPVSDLE